MANAVIESDSDGKRAFFMEDDNDSKMPELGPVSDSDEEDNDEGSVWFTDIDDKIGS